MDARRNTRSHENSVGSSGGQGAQIPLNICGRGRVPRGRARGWGDANPPQAAQATQDWENRFAEIQARINEPHEEIRQLRQQGAPAIPAPEIPIAPALL
ncbi:hypothetical protein CsatA_015836 [Cannabis sativa]